MDSDALFILYLLISEIISKLASTDELSMIVVKDHLSVVYISVAARLVFGFFHEIILFCSLNLMGRARRPSHRFRLFVATLKPFESIYLLLRHVLHPTDVSLGELLLVLDVFVASVILASRFLALHFGASLPTRWVVN